MRTEEFSFISTDGKTKVHAVKWFPDNGEFHAILQITHGMVEHIERYRPFAEFLTGKGFLVVGHDHLGHGRTAAAPKDRGYMGKPDPCELLIEDMHKLRRHIHEAYPEAPYFMMGHSMGSYMLRRYITKHHDNVDGVIFMGTGTVNGALTLFGIILTKLLERIKGGHYRSNFLTNNMYGKPYRKYDLTGQDPSRSWLTRDESIVKKYASDPLCGFTFTVNGYLALFEAVYYDGRRKYANRIPKGLPVLLISGSDDPVGDFGKGVKKAYDFYKSVGITDVTLKLYRNDRHELVNELDREHVFAEILAWMDDRMPAAK